MRVPLSWLREYVDVAADATPDDVLGALVTVGFEEEDVHRFEIAGPVVVGQVVSLEAEPQSNGKTINWCQVDVGEANGGVRGIVCGTYNFVAGDKVVVTLPGAVLPGPFPIAARKTYGHVSDGVDVLSEGERDVRGDSGHGDAFRDRDGEKRIRTMYLALASARSASCLFFRHRRSVPDLVSLPAKLAERWRRMRR